MRKHNASTWRVEAQRTLSEFNQGNTAESRWVALEKLEHLFSGDDPLFPVLRRCLKLAKRAERLGISA